MKNDELYPELVTYIFDYESRFMNQYERKAWIHNRATERLEYGNRVGFHKYQHQEQDLSKDENVLKLLENGYDHYKLLVATRIYNEHKNELHLNQCPKCNKIARTPHARQCRFCLHDWHQ